MYRRATGNVTPNSVSSWRMDNTGWESLLNRFPDFIQYTKDIDQLAGKHFIFARMNVMREMFQFGEMRRVVPAANKAVVFIRPVIAVGHKLDFIVSIFFHEL